VDGLKSFSPTDSDPKAVQKRTHWLTNELDQEAISTEDQVALTTVLGATHVHETKMELNTTVEHLKEDYLAVHTGLLDAQRRISELEDLVRILALQNSAAVDSLKPLDPSNTSVPAPSVTNRPHRDGERTREVIDDHVRDAAYAFEQSAEEDKLRLRAAQNAKHINARLENNNTSADRSPTPVLSDAKEVEIKSELGYGSESSASAQAAASTDKQVHETTSASNDKQVPEKTFIGNDKPLPPVPAAQAFPQVDLSHHGKRKQAPTDDDSDSEAVSQKENVPSATTTFSHSASFATAFELAKPVPAAAQSPQVVSSARPKSKATKWKDPPLFQDNKPTPASAPTQSFSVSSPTFNADGKSAISTEHATEVQQPTNRLSQQSDPKQGSSKLLTSNDNTRQLGNIMKVLQENKKLDEGKPLQKKIDKTPVFASAGAMMNMIKSVAPDSGYIVSPKPVVAAASLAAVPRAPSVRPTSRADSTPSINGSVSQSPSLEAPTAPTKKRKSTVKLVKPETELQLPATSSSSVARSSIKQEKPVETSLLGSSVGPSTPPVQAPAPKSARASTSPSTVATSSPLTPAPAPTIKITQAKKALSASVPPFSPSPSAGTASSTSRPSPENEMMIPEGLRKQMSPSMLTMFAGNLKNA
jgi:hypothetical protein